MKEVEPHILAALSSFGLQSHQVQELFLWKCTLQRYTKNEVIFSEERRNELEYLLVEGVLHRYNVNDKGDNVSTGFYMGPDVVTPHFARTVQGKSLFSLQALTDVLVAEIKVSDLDYLRLSNMEFRQFGLKVIEKEFSNNLQAEIAHRSSSAQERLSLLRKTHPGLENLVPHHIIASYLGITKVSLSRLRALP